jgi:dipeptidyl aminopeptidase/acylaminoacyl peptidase
MSRLIDCARPGALLLLSLCANCIAASAEPVPGPAIAASPPAPPALEIFGRLPAARLVTLSPNGMLIAMEEDQAGRRQVTIFEAEGGKTRHTVDIDKANKVRRLLWSDDETLLMDVSIMHSSYCAPNVLCNNEWFRTLSVRMDGKPPRVLLNYDGDKKFVSGSNLLASRTDRPGRVTMSTMEYDYGRYRQESGTRLAGNARQSTGWVWAAYDVDSHTGKEKLLATGTQYTEDWVVDAAGMPIARSEWLPEYNTYTILVRQGAGWKEIFKSQDGSKMALGGLDLAGKAIVALGANGTNRSQAWSIPLDGSAVTLLHANPEFDVDVAIYDENRNAVVGVRGTSDFETHWFDPKFASQQKSLENAFKGMDVDVLDRSAGGRRVLVEVDSPSQPAVYQLVDFDQKRADIVAEAYPGLDPSALGTVSYIRYLARDGTSIPAFLTLPPGRPAKNLPVVILPHGGPESRDVAGFDWLLQFLATRGYAVLQPQFRGSLGYGEKFRLAGYRQWGGLMQDDVSDGVRHLIANGTADPSRICIVGASYGGYAALAGAAFTPELYACAASIAGVSDLPSMIGSVMKNSGSESDAVYYWVDHIGPPTDPNTVAKSPSRSAATVRAPVLLLHGAEDTVVPIQQSQTMERALREAGKPVTFVTLPGEDHGLSRSATRTRVLQELEGFLAKHLAD